MAFARLLELFMMHDFALLAFAAYELRASYFV
jgi:hypothetical protein